MSEAVQSYDEWHTRWTEAEDRSGSDPLERPWHRTAARLLEGTVQCGRDVLEVGCGRGDFALYLANAHPHSNVTGVDVSSAAIQTATRRSEQARRTAAFRVGDAQALPFPSYSFDTIVSCETLEHVPEPRKMLREIRRVLRDRGTFIITTENYFNGMTLMWLKSWLTRTPFNSGSSVQPHENYFLYWRVRRMIEDAGLPVMNMESNHFQWLMLPRTDPAKLCTEHFENPRLNRAFRPFGRHFTFYGVR